MKNKCVIKNILRLKGPQYKPAASTQLESIRGSDSEHGPLIQPTTSEL